METSDTIRMANQIADFFKGYGHGEAIKEIADHINRFWEPRMRVHLFDELAKGNKDLNPLVKDASSLIRKPNSAAA